MKQTASQLRSARANLDLKPKHVADAVGLSVKGIRDIEREKVIPYSSTIERLVDFYENAGIEFTEYDGVRKRPEITSKTYRGQSGFLDFARDVYQTTKLEGGAICVSNVDERLWDKWMGDFHHQYLRQMGALDNIKSKIIIREGDTYKVAYYAEYRSVKPEEFGSVPFYVYGNKVAMILFSETDVIVVVITNREIAEEHRLLFERLWQSAHTMDEQQIR